jgi:hypothetical protein
MGLRIMRLDISQFYVALKKEKARYMEQVTLMRNDQLWSTRDITGCTTSNPEVQIRRS